MPGKRSPREYISSSSHESNHISFNNNNSDDSTGHTIKKPNKREYAGEATREFLTVLEAVANNIPVPGVSAVVRVAIHLIDVCEESQATLERAEELKLRIKALVVVMVNELKGKRDEEIQDKLIDDIGVLASDLRFIEKKLKGVVSQRPLLLVFFRKLNEEKVLKCISCLDIALERFNLSRQINLTDVLVRLEQQITVFYEAQRKALDHIQETVHDVRHAVDDVKVTMKDVKAILKANSATTVVEGTSSHPGIRVAIPANTSLFCGRDALVQEVAGFIVDHPNDTKRHVCILGPGGMGKTCTALAVMAHPDLKKRYSDSSLVWVPCIKATSISLFFDTLSLSLGIITASGSSRDNVISSLKSFEPVILLFDNFETPWNIDGGRAEVDHMLRDINQISHVTLFVTMRSSTPPCQGLGWHSVDLKPINSAAARQIYSSIHSDSSDDPELLELFDLLGHMPLAITLMATFANLTGLSSADLANQYKKLGTKILGQGSDSESNMDLCIGLSVDSPPMKRHSEAQRLLAVLAMLPVGTTFDMLTTWWARNLSAAAGALAVLLETSLVERRNTTFCVLPVIQRYATDPYRLPIGILDSMIMAACDYLARHKSSPGDVSYKKDIDALAGEESNLEVILLGSTTPNRKIIDALLVFVDYQAATRPRTSVIEHAVKLVLKMNDASLHGTVLSRYATVCINLNRYSDARKHVFQARRLFLSVGDTKQAARCLLDGVRIDHQDYSTSAIAQKRTIAQAQRQFEYIQDEHGIALCQYCLGVTTLQTMAYREGYELLYLANHTFLRFKDTPRLAECKYQIALALFWQKNYSAAEKWAKAAMRKYDEIGPSKGAMDAALTLGAVHNANGEYANALSVLARCLKGYKFFGAPVDIGFTLEEMGRTWAKMGKVEDARAAFQEALQVLPPMQYRGDVIRCRYFLRKLEDPAVVPTDMEKQQLFRFYPGVIEDLL